MSLKQQLFQNTHEPYPIVVPLLCTGPQALLHLLYALLAFLLISLPDTLPIDGSCEKKMHGVVGALAQDAFQE